MNKKIFLLLALASLFVSTHANYIAITCYKTDGTTADANCASCPNSGPATCTACNTGYYLSSGVCVACTAGCATCTGTTAATCTAAASGSYLVGTAGAYTAVGTCFTGCATCTGTTVGTCLTAVSTKYLDASPPTAVGTCFTGCATCSGGTAVGNCLTAVSGSYLVGSPPTSVGTCFTGCATCTGTTVGTCLTAVSGNTLTPSTGTPTALVTCGDTFQATACSATDTATTCSKGTLGSGICCGVLNCGTCATSTAAGATGANVVCATPASGYGLISSGAATVACATGCARCDAATGTSAGACSACSTGYSNTAATGVSPFVCVATTPVPTTDSPATSAFNVTPTAVFLNTETSTPAFTGVYGYGVYGPGFDDSTAYVWAIVVPTATTGTVSVNRRTINATYGSGLGKVNGTADTAITTSIAYGNYQGFAVGPGYLALASVVTGQNWGSAATATASEISVTYVAVNGSSATTKALTGNTNTNVYFVFQNLWIDTGVIYCIYTMSTHTPGVAAATGVTASAESWTLNGIYIQGVTISTGALLYNTTGGVKSIALTQSNSATLPATGCSSYTGTGCQSAPSSSVYNFLVGGTNITNSSTVNYVWEDRSATTGYGVVKTGTITLATGAGTAGTVLQSEAAATGSSTVAAPLITTTYSAGGTLGSFATSGVFVNKKVKTDTGAGSTATNPSYVYSTLAYINGSSTAAGNVTIVAGYQAPIIQGYGTSDGFILVEQHTAQTTPTNKQSTLVQVERFFTNGSTNGAATSLGTYQDTVRSYQDTNGSIYVGYTITDTLTQKTYSGYLGKYLAQSLGSGASTLTSIFAFLSLMIVAIFAF